MAKKPKSLKAWVFNNWRNPLVLPCLNGMSKPFLLKHTVRRDPCHISMCSKKILGATHLRPKAIPKPSEIRGKHRSPPPHPEISTQNQRSHKIQSNQNRSVDQWSRRLHDQALRSVLHFSLFQMWILTERLARLSSQLSRIDRWGTSKMRCCWLILAMTPIAWP